LVSFLLITAVWTQMARLNADAKVASNRPDVEVEDEEKETPKYLHVEMRAERKFELSWREANTVVSSSEVEREEFEDDDDPQYALLAEKVVAEWNNLGQHKGEADASRDQAVIHVSNTTRYKDIIAVIDAIYTPKRAFAYQGETTQIPAFNVTFAMD
jgi:biopolymer transport protein ExbD